MPLLLLAVSSFSVFTNSALKRPLSTISLWKVSLYVHFSKWNGLGHTVLPHIAPLSGGGFLSLCPQQQGGRIPLPHLSQQLGLPMPSGRPVLLLYGDQWQFFVCFHCFYSLDESVFSRFLLFAPLLVRVCVCEHACCLMLSLSSMVSFPQVPGDLPPLRLLGHWQVSGCAGYTSRPLSCDALLCEIWLSEPPNFRISKPFLLEWLQAPGKDFEIPERLRKTGHQCPWCTAARRTMGVLPYAFT